MKLRPSITTLTLFILVVTGFSLAGCHLPVSGRYPDTISDQELRQTISAQFRATAISGTLTPDGTGVISEGTPFPVNPTTVPQGGATILSPENPAYANPGAIYTYYARSGDTLTALSRRFDVDPGQITSPDPIPETALITPGQQFSIPNTISDSLPSGLLLPDSEVINSPSSVDFDTQAYIEQAGGFLSTYQESVDGRTLSGAQIVQRVSDEASISPRFLLAFLEYKSGWVLDTTVATETLEHPIGFYVPDYEGLYLELVLTGTHLNAGYYGWRDGSLEQLKFSDGSTARPNPTINAGTAGVQNLFAKFYRQGSWQDRLYGADSFIKIFVDLFGDPWTRADQAGPIFPAGLNQPAMELPFTPGELWSMTGGPHYSWNTGSPRGALDFAPVTGEPACAVSRAWVLASAPGKIVRSANNVVVIDLDGDGKEQTGWNIVYVHIADQERISQGEQVELDTPIGHPSCERGRVTGTHVHIARKYNGEWLFSDERLPFVLSGWQVRVGPRNYQGELVKDGLTVSADSAGRSTSSIVR